MTNETTGDPGDAGDRSSDTSGASATPPKSTSREVSTTRIIGGLSLLALGIGTVVYHILEDWSWVDSFYFSAVALTTVGFGDLSPTTNVSKLFTVFYIFSGISLIGALLNEFMKRHARRIAERTVQDS